MREMKLIIEGRREGLEREEKQVGTKFPGIVKEAEAAVKERIHCYHRYRL